MAKSKVLVQDIADSLNLSRTTVSKVLNNSGSVSAATRERVLKKVAEMNYKNISQFQPELFRGENAPDISEIPAPAVPVPVPPAPRSIAVLFSKTMDNQHIGFSLLSIFGEEISSQNCTLSLCPVYEENLQSLTLPAALVPEQVSGILCAEIFDEPYTQMLCSLGKPLLFIDAYASASCDHLKADILLMESQHHLAALAEEVIRRYQLKRVGFFGPYLHCLSFYERWLGFQEALQRCDLIYDKSLCVVSQEDALYFREDWLVERLKRMNPLPELFICTNDFMALQVIAGLKALNLSVPDDALVIGFDNIPMSAVSPPRLTTIDSRSTGIGRTAANMLLTRMEHPDYPYIITHLDTDIIHRDSTDRKQTAKRKGMSVNSAF